MAGKLQLGPVKMKANFTQIYDKTRTPAIRLCNKYREMNPTYSCDMPRIYDAQETLKDIYNETTYTPVIKWVHKHAEL